MLQAGRELDLTEKAFQPKEPAEVRPDDLEGDPAAMADVSRQVDGRHSAGADLPLQEVAVTERRAEPPEDVVHEACQSTG